MFSQCIIWNNAIYVIHVFVINNAFMVVIQCKTISKWKINYIKSNHLLPLLCVFLPPRLKHVIVLCLSTTRAFLEHHFRKSSDQIGHPSANVSIKISDTWLVAKTQIDWSLIFIQRPHTMCFGIQHRKVACRVPQAADTLVVLSTE